MEKQDLSNAFLPHKELKAQGAFLVAALLVIVIRVGFVSSFDNWNITHRTSFVS